MKLKVTDSPTTSSEEDIEIPTGNGSLIDYSSATSLPTFTDGTNTRKEQNYQNMPGIRKNLEKISSLRTSSGA